MVYQGPSRGCQTCRKRRVKCDGARPHCYNCVKRKQACPGFKDGFDTMLKDETALTAERIRKKKSPPVMCRASDGESGRTSNESNSFASISLSPDVELFSLCFFFENYVTIRRDPRITGGFMDYLLPLYSKASYNSPLSLATSAAAVNLAAMWCFHGPGTPAARTFYNKAMLATKEALNDESRNKSDELLLAVMILDFYETLSQRFSNQAVHDTHQNGALALVKHRGSTNFKSKASKGLLLSVRTRLVDTALKKKQGIVFHPEVWEDDGEMPHTPHTKLDLLSAELANLQSLGTKLRPLISQLSSHSAVSLGSDTSDTNETAGQQMAFAESLLQQALDLDHRLSSWPKLAPMSWQPVAITSMDDIDPTIRDNGLYESLCDVYSSLPVAHCYNSWRISSISLLQLLERCRLALPPDSVAAMVVSENYISSRLQSLVDGVCASVPFHLGNRAQPTALGDFDNVKYPCVDPDRFHEGPFAEDPSEVTVYISHLDHKRTAASVGGWFILNALLSVLHAARPLPDAAPSDPLPLRLRKGQMQWILGQLRRLQNIYMIPSPKPTGDGFSMPS